MPSAPTVLHTARLRLVAPDEAQTAAVADFYTRNQAHFAPWDPPLPAGHDTPEGVRRRLSESRLAFEGGLAWRWWLVPASEPAGPQARVIGSVHLSGVVRQAWQNCTLGYAIDAAWQGQGLMSEALEAVMATAFSPAINLHRVQAAVRPDNQRSLAVMRRGPWREEGLARDYLYIDGAWRDHLIFTRTNPDFVPPAHW